MKDRLVTTVQNDRLRPYLSFFLVLSFALGMAYHLPTIMPSQDDSLKSDNSDQNSMTAPLLRPETVPDFVLITDTDERKAVFFAFLRPYVDQINAEMLAMRSNVENLHEKQRLRGLSSADMALLDKLTEQFEIQPQQKYRTEHFQQLMRRIDVLPVSMVLAQAANESAWGTSRFATQGNNYFGQWCYSAGCGMVPSRRRSGMSHEVRVFDSVADSVRSYFMNLNTFPSYRKLRLIRQQLRQNSQSIDGISLSEGLDSYSERGQAYIEELQSMIYFNDLHILDELPQA